MLLPQQLFETCLEKTSLLISLKGLKKITKICQSPQSRVEQGTPTISGSYFYYTAVLSDGFCVTRFLGVKILMFFKS